MQQKMPGLIAQTHQQLRGLKTHIFSKVLAENSSGSAAVFMCYAFTATLVIEPECNVIPTRPGNVLPLKERLAIG